MQMSQGFTQLVEQIDRMVETVTTAPGLDDSDFGVCSGSCRKLSRS